MKNSRYTNSDGSSIYNVKQNVNQFLTDFAELDFTNIIDNGKFEFTFVDNSPQFWTSVGVTGETVNRKFESLIQPSGYMYQDIQTKLKPNTSYTVAFYGSVDTSNSVYISVSGSQPNQIYNLINSNEISANSASVFINDTTSGSLQKHVINFKTNSTAVSGTIRLMIQNLTLNPINMTSNSFICYAGLIELGDLPATKIREEYLVITDITTLIDYKLIVDNGVLKLETI